MRLEFDEELHNAAIHTASRALLILIIVVIIAPKVVIGVIVVTIFTRSITPLEIS
jgi:hypothetical protein